MINFYHNLKNELYNKIHSLDRVEIMIDIYDIEYHLEFYSTNSLNTVQRYLDTHKCRPSGRFKDSDVKLLGNWLTK